MPQLPRSPIDRFSVERVLTALRWEAVLQVRYQVYSCTAIAAGLSVGLLHFLPDVIAHNHDVLIPLLVVGNLQVTTFYFAAVLIQLDKAHGVTDALATAPFRVTRYLWVRALALMALGTAQSAIIVLIVLGPRWQWMWLFAGASLLSFASALFGVVIVIRHSQLKTFLAASVIWVAVSALPLLTAFGVMPLWAFAWHPMMPGLMLVEASSHPVSGLLLGFGLLAGLMWCGLVFRMARSRLLTLVESAGT